MHERIETVVIGGGQAGLTTGYRLKERDREFVILDAGERIGNAWRSRWDSLHLFTPARMTNLPGMAFPGDPDAFPTKAAVADYLEAYAEHFDLPIELGVRVNGLRRTPDGYLVTSTDREFVADNVIVAMASFQIPSIPEFADDIAPDIVQLHSNEYRNPEQLQDGGVLVVGAGNSGAEIALDVASDYETWLSGRDVGHIPFDLDSAFAKYVGIPVVMGILYHRVMTTNTPIGRRARPSVLSEGGALVRTKPRDLAAAGVKRVPRTTGVEDGLPVVGEDRVLDVRNIIWCTGFHPDFSWIDVPIFDGQEHPMEPVHDRGVVPDAPGLYFVGLFFLYALTSSLFPGIDRDVRHVVDHLVATRASTSIQSSIVEPISTIPR